MSSRVYVLISTLVGVICGFLTIHSLFAHSWTSIFLWVGVGLVVLYFSPDRRTTIYAGAVYGFVTIAAWLLSGFQGSLDQFGGLLVILIIASTLTGAAGAIGGLVFNWLFRKE